MFHLDFHDFFSAISFLIGIWSRFVYRSQGDILYRPKTLPPDATWNVAMKEAITVALLDVQKDKYIYIYIKTMVGNILFESNKGKEEQFSHTVKTVINRMQKSDFVTSLDREEA